MSWILSKDFTFEASHKLPFHDGKCARLHGHSWKGTVYVEGDALLQEGPKQGMVIDYSDIKKELSPLVERYLDHHHLNDTLELQNPTSEMVAQWIYERLKLPGLIAVKIEETCTSKCFYTELSDFSNAVLMG